MTGHLTPEQVDREYDHIFGISTRREYEDGLHDHAFGTTHLSTAKRIVERSGVCESLDQWWAEDHAGKHPGGRPPVIDRKSALVIVLAHMLAGGSMSYVEMARTLSQRLKPKQAALIGIPYEPKVNWYDRIYYAVRGVLELVDPYFYPKYDLTSKGGTPVGERITRRRIPTEQQYRQLREWRDPENQRIRQERMDRFCADLVHSSVALAGRHMQNWRGNTALDATFVAIAGKQGVNIDRDKDIIRPHSVDGDAGWYHRETEDHTGTDAKGRRLKASMYGYELELVTMARNHPDDDAAKLPYPLLALGVGCHVPGAITKDPARVYQELHRAGYPAGFAAVDRAYSSLDIKNFANPLRALGHDLGMDYRSNQLGKQTSYEQYILVEGTWYVNAMPIDLIDAEKDKLAGRITESERDAKIKARVAYQLKPKGRPDEDGFQRFLLPDPAGYDNYDADTGVVLDYPTAKTVTIPANVDPKGRDKFRQRYPYKSEQWKKWYGIRSIAEHSNAHLKDGRKEDLSNPYKRPGKGYAYQYLMATLATISGNVRKLKTFIDRLGGPRDPKSPERTSRAPRRNPKQRLPMKRAPQDGRSHRHPART